MVWAVDNLGTGLRRLRVRRGLSLDEAVARLADAGLAITAGTLARRERNEAEHAIRPHEWPLFAAAFRLSESDFRDELSGGDPVNRSPSTHPPKSSPHSLSIAKVPLLSAVCAGPRGDYVDWRHSEGGDEVAVFGIDNADGLFALRIDGRSMEPELRHGDLVIFRRLDPYEPAAIKPSACVAVHYAPEYQGQAGAQATVARWNDLGNGVIRLSKDNPAFPPRDWPREAFDQVGVLVTMQRNSI
jgi:SOS-response transcriptional repressor LexA